MKGIVFTELLEMVESQQSLAVVDDMIRRAGVDGAYTAVGTYPTEEMGRLLGALSAITGLPPARLLHAFGRHLLGRFAVGYPQFFDGVPSAFAFLERVDGYIHVEVRKLYPDADLPTFEYERPSDDCLVMTYQSPRGLADLAEGLIEGTLAHFGETASITREGGGGPAGTAVRFRIQLTAAGS